MVEQPIDAVSNHRTHSVIESAPISEEGICKYYFSSCHLNERVVGIRIKSIDGESIEQADTGSPAICFEDWSSLARFSAMLLRNVSRVPGGEEALKELLIAKYQSPNQWIPDQDNQRSKTNRSSREVRQSFIDELPENDISLMTSHSELFASSGEIKYQLDDTVLLTFPNNKFEVPILSLREAIMMAIQVLSDERTLDYEPDFYCPFLYGPEMRAIVALQLIRTLEDQRGEEDEAQKHHSAKPESKSPTRVVNAAPVSLQAQDAWEAELFQRLRDECFKPMKGGE